MIGRAAPTAMSAMEEQRGRQRARRTLLICLVAMLLAGAGAWWFVDQAERESAAPKNAAHPKILLLTNQSDVDVAYTVLYHRGATTGPTGTVYVPGNLAEPTGAETLTLDFQSRRPNQAVQWTILESADAALTSPRSTERLGDIARTVPSSEIGSSCPQAAGFDTAQVLSGEVYTDNFGHGEVSVVGGVPSSVQYPQSGERRAVNVLQIEAPAANDDATGSGGCHVNLINWEQVGGMDWQTPHVSGGSVLIGDVPGGQFVESANPALTDTQTLSWDLSGPASISYTLFDTSDQAHHEIYVFLGGALAALAATLLVEVVKAAPEAFAAIESPQTPSPTDAHPVMSESGSTRGEPAHGPIPPARANPETSAVNVRVGASPTASGALLWLGIGVMGGWVLRRRRRNLR